MKRDQYIFRFNRCYLCGRFRYCLPVRIRIKDRICQRQVCWECLALACKMCGKKEKK